MCLWNFTLVKCFVTFFLKKGTSGIYQSPPSNQISAEVKEEPLLKNEEELLAEMKTLYECECVKPNLTSESSIFITPMFELNELNDTKIFLKDIGKSATDLTIGTFEKIPDMLSASFNSLYEEGKNMLVGYPFEAVSRLMI